MAIASRAVATWRSLDDAAKATKVSRRTISRWVREGKLRAYTIAGDRRRFVDLDEIKRLREPKPLDPPEAEQ
jgi:excisionase family DNA binding protein